MGKLRRKKAGTISATGENLPAMENKSRKVAEGSVALDASPDEGECRGEGEIGTVFGPVRIAIYGEAGGEPEVREVTPDGRARRKDFLRQVAQEVEREVRGAGGPIPAAAIREVVENLIHAGCAGATISILDRGRRVIVADQGEGIGDVQRALAPGYSGASEEARRHIRGVGAGLPIAAAAAAEAGVALRIDANIGGGTVVTLDATGRGSEARATEGMELTEREKRALVLLHELGAAGPSHVARELQVALSTAHRTLTALERRGLVARDSKGKRRLTEAGIAELGLIFVG